MNVRQEYNLQQHDSFPLNGYNLSVFVNRDLGAVYFVVFFLCVMVEKTAKIGRGKGEIKYV